MLRTLRLFFGELLRFRDSREIRGKPQKRGSPTAALTRGIRTSCSKKGRIIREAPSWKEEPLLERVEWISSSLLFRYPRETGLREIPVTFIGSIYPLSRGEAIWSRSFLLLFPSRSFFSFFSCLLSSPSVESCGGRSTLAIRRSNVSSCCWLRLFLSLSFGYLDSRTRPF